MKDKIAWYYSHGEVSWIAREHARELHPAILGAIHKAAMVVAPGGYDCPEYQTFTQPFIELLAREIPHVSITDNAMVAYTRDFESGRQDRQVYCKLGRYLAKRLPQLDGAAIETIVTTFREANRLIFRIVTDKELVNAMFHTKAHSCMHPCPGSGRWGLDNHPFYIKTIFFSSFG